MELLAFSSNMAGYEGDSERTWDEFEWERFLREQDEKTEKYMELMEQYIDDPRRDEIIAREMGWSELLDAKDEDDEIEALANEDWKEAGDDSLAETDPEFSLSDSFENHSLYRAAFSLTVWIDQLFDDNSSLQNEPAAVKLATYSAMASAKLAAALSDDDADEIGMTIAYLKRALKATTTSMEGAAQLFAQKHITAAQHATLEQRLFQVRDGIINLMGAYRGEWRKRFGSH
jgi:hypothetical protein